MTISFLKFSFFMDPQKPETIRVPETSKATLSSHVFLNDLSPFIFQNRKQIRRKKHHYQKPSIKFPTWKGCDPEWGDSIRIRKAGGMGRAHAEKGALRLTGAASGISFKKNLQSTAPNQKWSHLLSIKQQQNSWIASSFGIQS